MLSRIGRTTIQLTRARGRQQTRTFAHADHAQFIPKQYPSDAEGIESGCLDTNEDILNLQLRKPGVASDYDMDEFLESNWDKGTIVIDTRNSNFSEEPGDEKTVELGTFPSGDCAPGAIRPRAVNIVWNRGLKTMDLDNSMFKNLLNTNNEKGSSSNTNNEKGSKGDQICSMRHNTNEGGQGARTRSLTWARLACPPEAPVNRRRQSYVSD